MAEFFKAIKSMNPASVGLAGEALYEKIMKVHDGESHAELKEDGHRIQIHKLDGQVRAYTRGANEYDLGVLPELTDSLNNLPNCVLDAEIIGRGLGASEARTAISKRKNVSEVTDELLEQYPLELKVFDVMNWEGDWVMDKVLTERRDIISPISEEVIHPSSQTIITNADALEKLFEQNVGKGYEGLVCKDPNSAYLVGKRTQSWIKVKRGESIDLAVLGFYISEKVANANNPSGVSNLLVGSLNEETGLYEPIGKVGGRTGGLGHQLLEALEPYTSEEKLPGVRYDGRLELGNNKQDNRKVPQLYVAPKDSVVVEVHVENIMRGNKNKYYTCGLDEDGYVFTMDHAVLGEIRTDKGVGDATTTTQITQMYEANKE